MVKTLLGLAESVAAMKRENFYRLTAPEKGMRLISVKMPEGLIQGIDELVRRGLYPSRSAVIRTAVRDLLQRELWPTLCRERTGLERQMGVAFLSGASEFPDDEQGAE